MCINVILGVILCIDYVEKELLKFEPGPLDLILQTKELLAKLKEF